MDSGGVPPLIDGVNGAFGIQFATGQSTLRESSISTTSILASSGFTGSLLGTSSYAVTASYAISSSHEITHEISSSYAETASYALNSGGVTYSSTYVTTNTTAEENKVYVFEQSTPYTLTLPLSPSDGDSIYISNRSTISTNSVNGNGEKIMGDTQNLNLDTPTAAFRLMYTTGNQGWVVLGAL